jgi:DNA-binding PadR family transcriptional regulator
MVDKEPRCTLQGLRVLHEFMKDPSRELSGAEIARGTSLLSGTLYPLLIRFEAAGWLRSKWESVDPEELGRPRRRYYRITGAGQMAYRNWTSAEVAGGVAWA